jgi:hypothetical protein
VSIPFPSHSHRAHGCRSIGLRPHPLCSVLLCRYGVSAGTGIIAAAGQGIAADASANIYVTGYFGGGTLSAASGLPWVGSYDVFVIKLNANGVVQWAKR